MNITNNMRMRLENHLAALNGTLDPSVNDHSLGGNSSGDMSSA